MQDLGRVCGCVFVHLFVCVYVCLCVCVCVRGEGGLFALVSVFARCVLLSVSVYVQW